MKQSKSADVVPTKPMQEFGTLIDQIRAQAVETKNEGLGKDCAQCLAIAVGNFEKFCKDRKGCRVLYSSCYVRYEFYPFFFPLDSKPNDTLADTVMAILP
uniref:Gnk2-homologous domain-containing protein n=1 Tax=Quercus lobata TaxID=97700 RepID=A0A7N2MJR1_QUELO